jgi:hypothetical protein
MMKYALSTSLYAVLICCTALLSLAQAPPHSPVPYTIQFELVTGIKAQNLPALQSYCIAAYDDQNWFILGGRWRKDPTVPSGLHVFFPAKFDNFPSPDAVLWQINPQTQTAVQLLDLSTLPAELGDPLSSTNQQCEYDSASDSWYIAGGYGYSQKLNRFTTFPTLIRIPVSALVKIANGDGPNKAQAIAALINQPDNIATNELFQVTGGALRKTPLPGTWALVFGQCFDGMYSPLFSGGFNQTYTNQVRYFALKSGTVTVVGPPGVLTSSDKTYPYNRRDLPIVYDLDPATGNDRIAAFGGVFPPGKIAGYTNPVYVTKSNNQLVANMDTAGSEKFSQYEAPNIVVYDGSTTYHTVFGGIGHYYYHQTPDQKTVYEAVTNQGRNDGLPFVGDVTTFLERSNGIYEEYIAPDPVPQNALHGASIEFIPTESLSDKFTGMMKNIVNLKSFQPGEKELIGYIYGGVEANFPLPCITSTGTQATNALYRVYLTATPWSGLIPATSGHEANPLKLYNHETEPKKKLKFTGTNPCASAKPQAPIPPAKPYSAAQYCQQPYTPTNQ